MSSKMIAQRLKWLDHAHNEMLLAVSQRGTTWRIALDKDIQAKRWRLARDNYDKHFRAILKELEKLGDDE